MGDQRWRLLELTLAVPETAACLAPDCLNPCDWSSRTGPRQMYCSDDCTRRTRSARESLENALAMLREQVLPSVTGHALSDGEDLEARIVWILRRYPAPGWEE